MKAAYVSDFGGLFLLTIYRSGAILHSKAAIMGSYSRTLISPWRPEVVHSGMAVLLFGRIEAKPFKNQYCCRETFILAFYLSRD